MSAEHSRIKLQQRRSMRGSQLAEFGPALAVLVGIVLVPFLDLTIIPIRWMLAQNIVNRYSRELALCETFSQSASKMNAEPSLATQLKNIGGIAAKSIDLRLRISRVPSGCNREQVYEAKSPGEIPAEWLPNGANAPCSYVLQLQIYSLMSPAIQFPNWGQVVPGLNAPVPLLLTASHEWENLGRDPCSKRFFLAE